MALWQQSMIGLARSQRVVELAQRQAWLQGLTARFVSGPGVDDAVQGALGLSRDGISASMFYLGEYVSDPVLIAQTVSQLNRVVAESAANSLDVCASVDPTQIGLMVDEATCTVNARVLAAAIQAAAPSPRQGHDTLMIDMEDASVTEATLRLYWSLRREGLPVAVTIQAYLHQTRADLEKLIAAGAWVRLVKGAFAEHASAAVRGTADRDSRYRRCASLLLSQNAKSAGVYPAFATHDHRLVEEIITQAAANDWPTEGYEFEMLFGVRPDLQRELADRGHRVRVYLPFGNDWFSYAIRRVGESPRNCARLPWLSPNARRPDRVSRTIG